MNIIAVVVALTQVLAVAESSAQVRLDTTYCWPTVVMRRADGGAPLSGRVQLYRVEESSSDSVRWVTEAGFEAATKLGRAEIVGVSAGWYLALVRGDYAERPLADWQPPPGRPTEIQVGGDPWRRPVQVQRFEGWSQWHIVFGNCADSIVVRVKPGEWVTLSGEKRIVVRPLVFPAPYHLRGGTNHTPSHLKP